MRYLSLCEDLCLLTLLQARGEAGHDVLLRPDHLHDLLVTLYAHALSEWQAKRNLINNLFMYPHKDFVGEAQWHYVASNWNKRWARSHEEEQRAYREGEVSWES